MNKIKIFLLLLGAGIIFLYLFLFTSLIEEHPSNTTRDMLNYRLGDVVEFEHFNKKILARLVYKYYFTNTIASDYMYGVEKSDKKPDYELLYDIMKKHASKYELPEADDMIIHLRIGDVVDWEYDGDIDELLEKDENNDKYINNYKYFDKMFEIIKDYNIKRMIIVGGYHTDEDHTRSEYYIDRIKQYLEKHNYEVKKRIDECGPDEDFCYMSNSKYFLKSGGRYSNLISKMVEFGNGISINIEN